MPDDKRTESGGQSKVPPGLESWDGKNIWEGLELLGQQGKARNLGELLRLTAILEHYRRTIGIPEEAREKSGRQDDTKAH